MTPRNWHYTLERFLVCFLFYQGVLWSMPHRSQAFVPLDDEDYITGKGRAARSSSGSCRFGWREFGDKCYIVLGTEPSERKFWSDANKQCRYMGSTLVSIHSKKEQDFLNTLFQHSSHQSVWIGLHRRNTRNDFNWVDGSPLNFRNWRIGYPNRLHRGMPCAKMEAYGTGKWTDVPCKISLSYICQTFKGANEKEMKLANASLFDESSGDGEEGLCNHDICQNGGSCVDDTAFGNFQCICASGYKGERCEGRSLCSDDACENGGSCVEDAEVGDFQCICMDGFNGERCGEKVSAPGFDISEHIYIIGAVTSVVSLIIIVVVFVCFKRSRNRRKNANDNVARPTEDTSITMSSCKKTQSQD